MPGKRWVLAVVAAAGVSALAGPARAADFPADKPRDAASVTTLGLYGDDPAAKTIPVARRYHRHHYYYPYSYRYYRYPYYYGYRPYYGSYYRPYYYPRYYRY